MPQVQDSRASRPESPGCTRPAQESPSGERDLVGEHLDRDFYLSLYPDVAEAKVDPVEHYLASGWREGRRPTADFDTVFYLDANPDVRIAGSNPFYHYLQTGRSEGRLPQPPEPLQAPAEVPEDSRAQERAVVSEHLDRDFYLSLYPDVAEAGIDPVDHYLSAGWQEGRRPAPYFDPTYYLAANEDVRTANVEPFFHYIVAGLAENRPIKRPFAVERAIISHAYKTREALAKISWPQAPRNLLGAAAMARYLDLLVPKHRNRLVLSFSHDEYTRVSGGIQNCVGDEQQAFNYDGVTYLHMAPATPALKIVTEGEISEAYVTVTIDGERLGRAKGLDVLEYLLRRQKTNPMDFVITIHSMLGHLVPFIVKAAKILQPKKSFFWVHDFSSLCSNHTLLRNDLEFCWSPPLESPACQVCVYGPERQQHLEGCNLLFRELNPAVLVPSDAARRFWEDATPHPYRSIQVLPHGSLEITGLREAAEEPLRTLRVAHVGAPVSYKGWDAYCELATAHWADPRYEFYLFAEQRGLGAANITHVPVAVVQENRDAMVDALVRHEIDVVVNWSSCYETFSFSTYESILSGAFVVVREDSGNAALAVRRHGAGMLVRDKGNLLTLFESEEIFERVRSYRGQAIPTGRLKLECQSVRHAFPQG